MIKKGGQTIELVLNDVVEHFEEEEDKVVISWTGVEEPRRRECLNTHDTAMSTLSVTHE